MATTLVTCYYPIKSKYPAEQYSAWAEQFLRLDVSIVVFTTRTMASIFRAMRVRHGNKPLYIVELPFEELDTWKLYKNQWIRQYELDHEKAHSPSLYAIWAQKPHFVRRAIELNPFGTEYFFWCDIGAFREGRLDPVIQTSFPDSRWLPADRILMSAVNPINDDDKERKADGICGDFLHVNRIVGGLWGGGREGCLRWLESYTHMLERYIARGRFAGKDQSVMLSTYLEDRSLANIVRCNYKEVDIWFYLTYLCSKNPITYELEASY